MSMTLFDPLKSYGICSANAGTSGAFSTYVTRQYDDLIDAVNQTLLNESWSSRDPLVFAEISHPRKTSTSILDVN